MVKAYEVQPGLAKMLKHMVETELPEIAKSWAGDLSDDSMTDEAVKVFSALGWLSSTQDPRIKSAGEALPIKPKRNPDGEVVEPTGGVAGRAFQLGAVGIAPKGEPKA